MKQCTKCGEDRPLELFTRDKSREDGLFPHCKICRKADKHQYYLAHKEQIFDYSQQWHKNNPNESKAIKKRYRDSHKEEIALQIQEARRANPDRFKAKSRRAYYKNHDRTLARQREYRILYPNRGKERYRKHRAAFRDQLNERSRQWYAAHSEIHNQRSRDWARRNPQKRLSYVHTRRARRLDNGGRYTLDQWEELKQLYGFKCLCCGEVKPLTIDHVIPIAKGGSNDISNIQPLCMRCNRSKATKTIDYRKKEVAQ